MDSAWFDCTSVMDSERGDDEFYSVYDGDVLLFSEFGIIINILLLGWEFEMGLFLVSQMWCL